MSHSGKSRAQSALMSSVSWSKLGLSMLASLLLSLASRDWAKGQDLPPGFSRGLLSNVVKQSALSSTVVGFHSVAS